MSRLTPQVQSTRSGKRTPASLHLVGKFRSDVSARRSRRSAERSVARHSRCRSGQPTTWGATRDPGNRAAGVRMRTALRDCELIPERVSVSMSDGLGHARLGASMVVRLRSANRCSSCPSTRLRAGGCVAKRLRWSPLWDDGRPTLTDSDDATDHRSTSRFRGRTRARRHANRTLAQVRHPPGSPAAPHLQLVEVRACTDSPLSLIAPVPHSTV
jgi:hypothetical protein